MILERTRKLKGLMLLLIFLGGTGVHSLFSYPVAKEDSPSRPLSEILMEFSEKYQIFFSYDSKSVSMEKSDFEFMKEEAVENAMDRLLTPLGYRYESYGEKFFLIIKENKEGEKKAKKLRKHVKKIQQLEGGGNFSIQSDSNNGNKKLLNTTNFLLKVPTDKSLTGTVTSGAGDPLVGATVRAKETNQGTLTDEEGKFELTVSDEVTALIVSYIGFATLEVEIGDQTSLTITLEESGSSLDEVVVIGYGTAKKSDITGSVSSIKSEEINKVSTARVDDAIRGKVAGLQIVPTSSAPGAPSTIRIRGSNSISANNEPLYVIDGFIGGGDLNDINVNDIESVEVLKDASATALYGSRGANGVILITTKRGKAGISRISYDGYAGIQQPIRLLDMLNAAEFADWTNEVKGSPIYPNPAALGEGTDWQEEVYRDRALITSHTLSVSGGNDKTRFYISGNYFNQDGIYIESNLTRYQFRINADQEVNKFVRIGNSLTLSRTVETPRSANIINTAGWDPTLPVRDENGDFTFQTATSEFSEDNPVALATLTENQNTRNRVLGNLFAEVEPIPGLVYKLNLGINLDDGRRENYAPTILRSQLGTQGAATITNEEFLDLLMENTLTYAKDFGDHSINVLGGYTRQRIFERENSVQTRGFVTDAFSFNNLGAGVERSAASSDAEEIGFESFLFRANYSWKRKILLTFSARSDGSSVFAANNKRAFFPSGAIAWRLIEEPFIQNLGVFDDLKLRASYGRLGNPGLGFGASLTRLSNAGNNYILGVNQEVVPGIAANALGNDDLRWETTNQFDIGIDAGFFNNRLQTTLDYYYKRTEDLLVDVQVPWLTSFQTSLTNFGEISNQGVELAITSVNVNRNGFLWETNFNIAFNRNEVLDIFNEEGFIFINTIGGVEAVISGILQEGEPIGTFYGMVRDGIWNSTSEIDASGLSGFSVFPGGKRFVDLNGDGVISAVDDRQIIGDANPNFFGGIGNNLSYRGFDLSFFFTFTVGNEIFNETDSRVGTALDNNTFARFADRWTPDNPDSNVPSAEGAARTLITSDTGVIEDGSFLRLRNINLGYNFSLQKTPWIQSLRLYVSGVNIFTIDNYSGYDPEINRGFDNLRRGYDQAQYPTTEIYNVGLQATF